MKLLLDQGLPRSAVILLSELGIETKHVSEINMAKAEDEEIIEKAREKGYIVVTLDADFHTLLALNEAISPSVIRMRMEGLRAEILTKILEKVIDECAQELEVGAAITVEQNRIRIRRLPLLSNI